VWECGDGQTDRHTDGLDQYAFRLGYASGSREIYFMTYFYAPISTIVSGV